MRTDGYNPSLSRFDIDMARGAQGELWVDDVAVMLAQRNGQIEVKCDYRYIETGRLYIEHECRGRDGVWRPSGIATTRAKLWAFKLGPHPGLFVFCTDWLRAAYARAALDDRNHVQCDYGENPTRGIVVYLNHFLMTVPGG